MRPFKSKFQDSDDQKTNLLVNNKERLKSVLAFIGDWICIILGRLNLKIDPVASYLPIVTSGKTTRLYALNTNTFF